MSVSARVSWEAMRFGDDNSQSLWAKNARAERLRSDVRRKHHLDGNREPLEEQVFEKRLIEGGSLWFKEMLHMSKELRWLTVAELCSG